MNRYSVSHALAARGVIWSMADSSAAFPSPAGIRDACALSPARLFRCRCFDHSGLRVRHLCTRGARCTVSAGRATTAAVLSWLSEAPIELRAAFDLRNELCNLKKCIFFVFQQASNLERQLSQLRLFHGEHQAMDGSFLSAFREVGALSDARTRARARAPASPTRARPRSTAAASRAIRADRPTFLCDSQLAAGVAHRDGSLGRDQGDEDDADQGAGGAGAVIRAARDALATARSSHASAQAAFQRRARWPPHAVAFLGGGSLPRRRQGAPYP